MLVIVVEFHIQPAHVADFRRAIVANARQSLSDEPGCHRFDVCEDPKDPRRIFLYELYDDERAFAAHLQSPHYLRMSAETAAWVSAKAVRQLRLLGPQDEPMTAQEAKP
jgi:(4S)-4-hydroxy-5-phosphonooxypentane-2,3-dione isomerase